MIKENSKITNKDSDLDLSICIASYNGKKMLEECLESIYKNVKELAYEVLVVDNNSSDGSAGMVKTKFSELRIIENKANYGFAKANNQAMRMALGRYILLLNQDVVILDNNSLKIMKEFLDDHKQAAVCGCNYVGPDGIAQFSQFRFQTIRRLIAYYFRKLLHGKEYKTYLEKTGSLPQEVDVVIGACFMIKKEVIDEVGLLDEAFFFYFEEADWCFRIKRAGWRIYILPWVYVKHRFHNWQALDIKLQYQYYRSQYLFFKKNYGYPVSFLLLVIEESIILSKLLYTICRYLFRIGNQKKYEEYFAPIKNAFRLLSLVNTMPL